MSRSADPSGPDHAARPDRPALAIGLRLLSGFLIAGMYVAVKAVGDAVPLGEIVFFRSVFAMIPLVLFLCLRGEFPHGLATRRPGGHMLRAGLGACALFASFAALSRLSLAEAVLMAQLSPMLMAVAAGVLLSERLTRWRITGLVLGFAGVVVLVWPDLVSPAASGTPRDGTRLVGIGLGLLAAALSALALIMVRELNRTESPGAIALYFVLVAAMGALLTLPFGAAWTLPGGGVTAWLVLSGLFGGAAHIAMTLSFRYAEASRLAPFEYVALLWPLLADLLIFRLTPSATFLVAAPLVLAGALVAAGEGRRRSFKTARTP